MKNPTIPWTPARGAMMLFPWHCSLNKNLWDQTVCVKSDSNNKDNQMKLCSYVYVWYPYVCVYDSISGYVLIDVTYILYKYNPTYLCLELYICIYIYIIFMYIVYGLSLYTHMDSNLSLEVSMSNPNWGWWSFGKSVIRGHQWRQCRRFTCVHLVVRSQSEHGQRWKQSQETWEASGKRAEAEGRLLKESHRKCSLLEKAQDELHSWLQVKGYSERYQARERDRRNVRFSTLLGSVPFWALPDHVTEAGKKTTPWQTGAGSRKGNFSMLGVWFRYDWRWHLALFQCYMQEETASSQCGIGIHPLVQIC